MKAKIELISTLIKKKKRNWTTSSGRTLTIKDRGPSKELNYYKNKYEQGELFEPNF